MRYAAVYWRYGTRYTKEFDEEHEAVNFLREGEDMGSLSSEAVTLDGEVLHDKETLFEMQDRDDWGPMAPTIDSTAVNVIEEERRIG